MWYNGWPHSSRIKKKSETIFGVTVQNNLKWNTHISDVRNKLKKRIAGIYKIRYVVPFQTLKTISEGWVNSVLVYCLPLFGGCELADLKDLQVVQNKVARLVTCSDQRTHRELIYDQL